MLYATSHPIKLYLKFILYTHEKNFIFFNGRIYANRLCTAE